ncbi:cupin domain-containing protein [Novosphingobium sp. JCM 18896]|uniref:cupin domain-containing protein n=1 Tax=Novosphingobium sp. JCM 18896 TaxID=2989731 RepID=UPI002223727F|nr:cupin domain-containing protein [Novosphingobium sp. JCM 18896]MCW1431236.1 cupin domain-containing protein [Novosphingobium sp. JCM 18896]
MQPPRRVVTGLDADGRSTVIIDGPAPSVIWSAPDCPADNDGNADAGNDQFDFPETGTNCIWVDIPPGGGTEMHATATIDYLAVLSGEITLVTETGKTVLRPGDILVDRGVVHAWQNEGTVPCRILGTLVAAKPIVR